MKQKTKIFFTLVVIAAVFAVVSVAKIKAGTGETGRGFLLGGGTEGDGVQPWDGTNTNVGWISLNSANCDVNGNGSIGVGDTGRSADCPPFGTTVANYGVNIPTKTDCDITASDPACQLSGYAWSPNLGWISFNAADLAGCPTGTCSAQRSVDTLVGWARIVGIKTELAAGNSGGWEGWISLNAPGRAITVNGNNLQGYAWSEELGWIDFSRASIGPVSNTLKICLNSCDASGILIGNALGMAVGETKNLKACYGSSGDCNDEDVTVSVTQWNANDTPNDAVSLSVGPSDVALSADAAGSENVSATYTTATAGFTANVMPAVVFIDCYSCSNGNCSSYSTADTCAGTGGYTLESDCIANCKKPDGWIEVAP